METEKKMKPKVQRKKEPYIVFYDAKCPICRRSRRLLEKMGSYPPLHFIDVNNQKALSHWPMINPKKAKKKVTVLTPELKQLTAYDAIIELLSARSKIFQRLRPIAQSQPAHLLGHKVYDFISRNRMGIGRFLGLDDEKITKKTRTKKSSKRKN